VHGAFDANRIADEIADNATVDIKTNRCTDRIEFE